MRQIDEMTLPQVLELFEYWNESPPMHELYALRIGFKPPSERKKENDGAMGPADFAAWAKASGGRKLTPNG